MVLDDLTSHSEVVPPVQLFFESISSLLNFQPRSARRDEGRWPRLETACRTLFFMSYYS